MRRRQVLTGLVGITAMAHGAIAPNGLPTHLAQQLVHLQPLLAGTPNGALPAVGPQALRRRITTAHSLFQACRYDELAARLPGVIATAQASTNEARGTEREYLSAMLADAYSLAANLCNRLHDDALAWVTAERARAAAHVSGNPAAIAEAARMTSIALRRHGHHDTATSLLTTTAMDLGADTGKPAADVLATYGSLLCTASYTAAQNGDRTTALDLITEADTAAARLTTQSLRTPFNRTNVDLYQIGIRTALGDAGTALEYAKKIKLRGLPTPERQARYCLDTARAWHRFGNTHNSFRALQAAEHIAPEDLRRSSVRSLITTLVETPGPTPFGLREFAALCGAVA